MINIYPISALKDNYIWLVIHLQSKQVLVVDPGEALPVLNYLKKENLTLTAILITHHHWDHTDGIEVILQEYPSIPVYGSVTDHITHCTHMLGDNDQIAWPDIGIEFSIFSIPGHTHGHIAYYGHNSLFCGDTLFTGGCGRIFEGTAGQMYSSLERLKALPDSTDIYCGHEYTEANLRFAEVVEPNNPELLLRIAETAKLRQTSMPTVPASLGLEKETNPFLRCHLHSIQQAVSDHVGQNLTDPVAVFAGLRQWKNQF